MAEYTYKDIIIDPNSEEAKNAVGKEVFFDNMPYYVVVMANANANGSDLFLPEVLKDVIPGLQEPFRSESGNSYSCIILKKEDTYEERAKKWIKENNLKKGDYVKVTRKAEDGDGGWFGIWIDDSMTKSVGKILKSEGAINLNYSIKLEDGFYYPYFVLEKVEEPETQYVPFESMHEFISAYYKANNEIIVSTESMLSGFGMWLKSKDEEEAYKIVSEIWDDGVVIGDRKMWSGLSSEVFNDITTWEELIEEYTFLDGTTCGKLKEENNG